MMFPTGPGPHGIVTIRPRGRMTMAVASQLRDELTALVSNGNSRLAVDMGDVESVDSSVIGALITGLKAARSRGGDLRIVAAPERVRAVLNRTNLNRVLPTYASVGDAFREAAGTRGGGGGI